jgi:hypothetical protein
LTAIKEAVTIARDAHIAFKHDKYLEQAGFNPSKPHRTAEPGDDHNHPLGAEDTPRQLMHAHALLLVLPVDSPIPEQVLHPITPH